MNIIFDGCITQIDVMSIILAKTNSTIEIRSTIESVFGPELLEIVFLKKRPDIMSDFKVKKNTRNYIPCALLLLSYMK